MSGGAAPPSAARAALSLAKGGGEGVGEPAGPLEHLALVVRTVSDLITGGDGLRLRLGESRTAFIGEIAEGDQLEAVTVRADFFVDLEAALQLRRVVSAERTVERPMLARRRGRLGVLRARRLDNALLKTSATASAAAERTMMRD